MLNKIISLSTFAFLMGMVACHKDTAGITEEGNSIAYDLWDGTNGIANVGSLKGNAGYWFSVSEENDNGSSIKFPSVEGNNLTLDNLKSVVSQCGGLCGTVQLGESSAPNVGVGIALTDKDVAVDISEWDGLCVSYESDLPMKGVLGYKDGADGSADDMPSVNFDKTVDGGKVSRCAKWADFKQSSNNGSGVEASKKATSIMFKFFGKAKDTGYFNIKGVSSYKHGIENIDSVEIVGTPKAEPASCLWNGTSSKPGSFVKNDLEETTGGLWYSYNDRVEGGVSLLYWSAEVPNYNNSQEWITDEDVLSGGLFARVALDMGVAPQAYAGVGIKMVARESENAEYSPKNVDISDWGGICVYYIAEKDMRMVLVSDSLEAVYVLEANATPAEKCIAWNDLSSSGLEKKASDIKFEIRSNENLFNQIRFNVIAVGRYSTSACVIDSSKVTSF